MRAVFAGLDFSRPQPEGTWQEILEAFHKHSVLVFHEQNLTTEQQKKFAENFGPVMIPPFKSVTVEGHPECLVMHNDATSPAFADKWHTDSSGWLRPPLGTVLYARIVPKLGGDTLFSNMHLAYAQLSPPIRSFLDGLNAVHDDRKSYGPDFPKVRDYLRKHGIDPDAYLSSTEPVLHPVVRTHPVTGRKALYHSTAYVTHIEDLTQPESKAVLAFLDQHIQANEFIYRHHWRKGDMVIWDNRSVQHYAVADYFPEERLMHRLNIEGDRPT
ncbi:TauD/TfdA dioxygenase family protein [Streptomyces sp. MS2.AVA.5]|uniref:TauD/TfdA family dioxygenase n=1 Tax=Streptomyces achmelvichensis TaxID=3134111 RepID=A0ACC6PLB0_9ACTN